MLHFRVFVLASSVINEIQWILFVARRRSTITTWYKLYWTVQMTTQQWSMPKPDIHRESWISTPKCKNVIFSKNKQFIAMASIDPLNTRWRRSAILKIDMTSFFSAESGPIWIKISQTGAEWHVDCGDMAEIETRSRIPIWQMFGRIQLHFITKPPAIAIAGCCHLANSVTCHPRATCHVAGCKNSIRHIENRFFCHILFIVFVFLIQFGLWRVIVSDTLVFMNVPMKHTKQQRNCRCVFSTRNVETNKVQGYNT